MPCASSGMSDLIHDNNLHFTAGRFSSFILNNFELHVVGLLNPSGKKRYVIVQLC